MAKKKTESAASAGETKPAAAPRKKAPAKKAAAPAAASPVAGFGIDTNLAAQAAAKMLLKRPATPAASSGGGGTVKHLKDSLNKPSSGGLGNLLGGGSAGGNRSSNLPHFGGQQKGHNQSTGHVGNVGVPRRTPG